MVKVITKKTSKSQFAQTTAVSTSCTTPVSTSCATPVSTSCATPVSTSCATPVSTSCATPGWLVKYDHLNEKMYTHAIW
ncbi:early growth response protein 1-like isoform X7 [Hydra vulgaris]|uniref:early growth response protein 1-like isoform X7 n=1 Tax=Hydra vulgaris TaxID=6087 RepID=UPI0032E9D919